jgi:hypothetical protein
MTETTETLDEKIDRVLNTRFESFNGIATGALATRAWSVYANFSSSFCADHYAHYGSSYRMTVGELMSVPRTNITRQPNSGYKTAEVLAQAVTQLIENELGISIPFFDNHDRFYPNPQEAIKEFIANQNIGAKLSMTFNLESFMDSKEDGPHFTLDTHMGSQPIWISIGHEDFNKNNRLTLYLAESDRGENLLKTQFQRGVAKAEIGDCFVTVKRTGDDFKLDIVQRLG